MEMRVNNGSGFSVADAVGMYRRLRERGQSSLLARLSVEAHCTELPPNKRRQVSQVLREIEAPTATA
jgi:hypothetical protein